MFDLQNVFLDAMFKYEFGDAENVKYQYNQESNILNFLESFP